jgi:hypothetical protein
MIENLPNYIAIVFGITTLATFLLFHIAIKKSSATDQANWIGLGIVVWLVIQMALSINLYYLDTVGDIPPKFPLLSFIPTFALMIVLFNTEKGKIFIDSLPLNQLTFLSIVRIPVEIVLWWLFIHNTIPELMTFEGVNYDILAGITAPFIAYFGFKKGKLNNQTLLGWNIVSLLLLTNIVINALFSFPTVIQLQAFDQPNVGLLYFPFIWLPAFIVPVVYFTHFVSIRQLLNRKSH